MSAYTKGPWFVVPMSAQNRWDIEDGLGYSVAVIANLSRRPCNEANASLIGAAPDLLAALETIVKSLADQDDEGMIEHVEPMIAARAAIAKATGGAL